MRGSILLTEARSGSSWLGSLSNSTGCLGTSNEWFVPRNLGPGSKGLSGEACLGRVLDLAATPNGVFAIKLFPAHLHAFQHRHGIDLIDWLTDRHDVTLLRLTRRNRALQAVSFARSLQSRAWNSRTRALANTEYEFATICRCYFLIDRSEAFWTTYLELRGHRVRQFVYEDLLSDPSSYIRCLADHAGVPEITTIASQNRIQRDDDSDAWAERFLHDAATLDLLTQAAPSRPFRQNPANLLRFLRGRQMKPYPYSY